MNIGGADGKDLEMQGGRRLRASVEDTTSGPKGPRYSSGWEPVGCVCGSKGGQHEWVGEPRQMDSVPVGRGVFQTPPEPQDLLFCLYSGAGGLQICSWGSSTEPDPSHTSYPVSGATSPVACGVSNVTPTHSSAALPCPFRLWLPHSQGVPFTDTWNWSPSRFSLASCGGEGHQLSPSPWTSRPWALSLPLGLDSERGLKIWTKPAGGAGHWMRRG